MIDNKIAKDKPSGRPKNRTAHREAHHDSNKNLAIRLFAAILGIGLAGALLGVQKAGGSEDTFRGPEEIRPAELSGKILVWVDRAGTEEPLPFPPNEYRHQKISPDGTRVALTLNISLNNRREIWIWNLIRKTAARFTSDGLLPLWTQDGKRIAFSSGRDGNFSVLWKPVDAAGEVEQLASAPDRLLSPSCWSKDGNTLFLYEQPLNPSIKTDITYVSVRGARKRIPLLHESGNKAQPRLSPDGRWIAYRSDESGQNEVYVRPFPEVTKGKWQISANGGSAPLWSPDGRELFYCSSASVMSVSVTTQPGFRYEVPIRLFNGNYLATTGHSLINLEISPNGKRFLLLKNVEGNR